MRQRVPTIGPRSRASASSGDLLGSSFSSELAQRGSDTSEAFPKPRLPRVRRPAGPQRTGRGHVHGTGVMRREERATRCSRGRPRLLPSRGWDVPAGDGGGTGHSGCPQTPRTKRGTRSGTPDVPLPPQRRLLFKLHRPCSPASGAEPPGFGAATPGLAAAFTTGRDPRAEAGQGHRWTAGWAPRAAGRQLAGPVQSTAAACPRQNVPSPARRPPCALVVPTVFHQVCLFSGVRRCHPTSPQLELSPRTAPPRVPTPESHRPAALPRRRLSPGPCCSHTLGRQMPRCVVPSASPTEMDNERPAKENAEVFLELFTQKGRSIALCLVVSGAWNTPRSTRRPSKNGGGATSLLQLRLGFL